MNLQNNHLIRKLIEFGLNEKESLVYISLIELEIATASQISKTTNLNRSTTYVILEFLKKKGLVNLSEDKKIQHYVAITPETLFEQAQSRTQKAREIEQKIREIIPELKALHKDTKQKPKVRVFEGKQGFASALNDSLDNKTKLMRECSSSKNIFQVTPDGLTHYIQKRIELGIRMNGIHPDDKTEKMISRKWPKIDTLGKSIFIPPRKYKFPADIMIYDDKICYLSPDKRGFAIIIESKEMAEVMKNIFDLAYKEAQRIGKIVKT
jgi:sugar-specific transcriptional regulator TrmB